MVTVIIITYNCAAYLIQALESVLNQTYQDLEIIVVDDGSTDATQELLAPYLNRIRYHYKDNGGEASARNAGLELATGDYIAFLDADDLYKPNKIEEQIKIFQQFPTVDVVYTDIEAVDENLQPQSVLKSEGVYLRKEDFLCMMMVRQIIPATAAMMFKRQCIEGGIHYPEQYTNAVDYEFTLKLAHQYQFYYLEKPLYIYRRHSGNLTNMHQRQLDSEKAILRSFGISHIRQVVANSNFNSKEKELILAKILIKLDEWNLAEEILENLAHDDNDVYVWFYLGNCKAFKGKNQEAIYAYQKALLHNGKLAEAHNNLGLIYTRLNKPEEAFKHFQQASLLRTEYIDARRNLEELATGKENNFILTIRELRKTLTIY